MNVEFKSDLKKYSDTDLFEDVVAFANTEGGDLYLGVEDDGTITGAHKNHANPVTLSAYIANNTVPPISTRMVIIEEEHPVLKISVPKSYGGIAETRMPAPEFDRRAFREAVVNAFSHRDYSIIGCVRMAVTEEGLTVANPGGLIEGVTVQNLCFCFIVYPQKRAGGPTGKDDRGGAKPAYRPLPVNTLLVRNLLKDSPRSDVKQLSDALNLPETMVKSILGKAIETGVVEGYGAGRGQNYILSHKLYQDRQSTAGYVRQRDIDEARYQKLIVSVAKSNEYISRVDVVKLLHVKEPKAYGLLKSLVVQGVLQPVNKGWCAKYRLLRASNTF